MVTRDDLHRTVKLELDQGRAATITEAESLAATYQLQIQVGPDVAQSPTRQAALLTAVNAGCRAFRGGVCVTGDLDWDVTVAWYLGTPAAQAITLLGGRVVETVDDEHPTIVIGTVEETPGSIAVRLSWDGWTGGLVLSDHERLREEQENPLAGIVAAAVAVSEAFAHSRGAVTAGREPRGLSLWRPSHDWRTPDAVGPELRYLPTRLWLGGLGHLGQAYLWALALLPYATRADVLLVLQDFDHVVEANRSTGLLVEATTANGTLKTRMAAAQMERLGFTTRLVERRFDDTTRPDPSEPAWLLAGFDNPTARAHLGAFDFAVDLGLGATADDYLGIHLHTFPAAGDPTELFAVKTRPDENVEPAPWAVAAGGDRCGVLQLQGTAVGAAFVGAVAGALGVAEVLRTLAGSAATSVGSVSLNALADTEWVVSGQPGPANSGYQLAGRELAEKADRM